MRIKQLTALASALWLSACSLPDEQARLAKQGLPPADFVGSVDEGRTLYAQNCAGCHGRTLTGTGSGPALLHKVYAPGHHADLAFYRAVKDGVAQHHWQFGDMPAQTQVSPTDAGHIVAYVRQRQQRRGVR